MRALGMMHMVRPNIYCFDILRCSPATHQCPIYSLLHAGETLAARIDKWLQEAATGPPETHARAIISPCATATACLLLRLLLAGLLLACREQSNTALFFADMQAMRTVAT